MSSTTPSSAITGSDNSGESKGTTTAKVASATHSAVDVAAANLEKAEHALREARAAAGHKVADATDHAAELSKDALSAARTYINLYPLRSLGIGIAIGYLLFHATRK